MDSIYEQFAGHEAEPLPDRKVGAFANREDNTKPYVNSSHSERRESSAPAQEDKSYYAWWRLVSNRQPNNSFEQSVNIAFRADNPVIDGHNYDDMRAIYINLYKNMMG